MDDQTKLTMQSQDLSDLKFAQLQALFPQVFTEAKDEGGNTIRAINTKLLEQEINTKVLDGKKERYEFTWPDKRQAIRMANTPTNAALRPCREESVDFDTTENLYIEGDNLEVLKLLRETYLNKVKMIYIDPPYNTGNDFIYEDDFSESVESFRQRDGQFDEQGNRLVQNLQSKGRFHTDWLNMMYSRLKFARDLLTSDGVIFISIDDSEIANLRKICDEVFGESSFVTTIHVEMSTVQGMKVKAAKMGNIVKNGEFILVYSKNQNKTIGITPLLDPTKYDNHYNKFLTKNDDWSYKESNLVDIINKNKQLVDELKLLELADDSGAKSTRLQEYYEYSPRFREFIRINCEQITRVHDAIEIDKSIKEKFLPGFVYEYESEKRLYLLSKNERGDVSQRIRLSEKLDRADDFYNTYGPTTIRGDWWPGFYLDMGNVNKEGGVSFNNGKKPVRLIKQLIRFTTDRESIIMDFFSGSSTTAHAVMQLNAEDGIKRKFIMVQLPEITPENSPARSDGFETICDIGKERIRRAGRKIKEESPITTVDLDVGFRVLKLDSSNMKEVFYTPEETLQKDFSFDDLVDNIKEDRSGEDLLFQVMLELGIELSSRIKERAGIYYVEENYLIACFKSVDEDQIKMIAQKEPKFVVFRDSSFTNDSDSVNFDQVFATYSPSTIRRVL